MRPGSFHLCPVPWIWTSPTEQIQLADLNLLAGHKAKRSTAYEAALRYFSTGIELLGENAWEDHYDLSLDLFSEAGEAAYLSAQYSRTEALAEDVFTKPTPIVKTTKWGI